MVGGSSQHLSACVPVQEIRSAVVGASLCQANDGFIIIYTHKHTGRGEHKWKQKEGNETTKMSMSE